MSLLDKKGRNLVKVFMETTREDEDGNTITEPSDVGIEVYASLYPVGNSGTSARRTEQDNEGFETDLMYSLRFPRSFPHVLGAQSQVEYKGNRWVVHGDVIDYSSSERTAHHRYVIRRF